MTTQVLSPSIPPPALQHYFVLSGKMCVFHNFITKYFFTIIFRKHCLSLKPCKQRRHCNYGTQRWCTSTLLSMCLSCTVVNSRWHTVCIYRSTEYNLEVYSELLATHIFVISNNHQSRLVNHHCYICHCHSGHWLSNNCDSYVTGHF